MTRISFVIPAHNEEKLLGETVATLQCGIRDLKLDAEIIVVDDVSTDETGRIARSAGARVIDVDHRQIAAVRNSGAREATGDTLIFVDADTLVPQETIRAALDALDDGAVAAGVRVAWDDATPSLAVVIAEPFIGILRVGGVMPGCCIAVRRVDFEMIGGFDEKLFAAEEIALSKALGRLGRCVFVHPPVVSSGRKMRSYSVVQLIALSMRAVLFGLDKRENLPIWYDAKRD